MQIGGLQKLSLIDYPGKIACILFLFGCSFRCGFCHNPSLVIPEREVKKIFKEEVLEFLERRRKYLDGVCITGGEPLINKELPAFIEEIKKLGYAVKIDTNGTNPAMLKELIERKLVDYIAMDVKADKENYDLLTNTKVYIEDIEESMKLTMASGLPYEFRTTCIPGYHTKKTIENLGLWMMNLTGNKPRKYVLQRFIPRDNGLIDERFSKIAATTDEELGELKESAGRYFENVTSRG